MKRLIFLLLLFPFYCSANVALTGVDVVGSETAYFPKILTVGDSITVGNGAVDVLGTGVNNIGSYRIYLQDTLIGKRSFVGQWGNIDGENPGPDPELDTKADDNNYLLPAAYSPRHFGMSGKNIATMVEAFTRLNQLDWFSATSTGDIVIILLGTNNRKSDGGDPPSPDTSLIVSEVTELLSLAATIHDHNSNIEVVFCLLPPQLADPSRLDVAWQNEWVLAFNTELISQFIVMPANPHNHIANLYTDLSRNQDWYDGTYSRALDLLHPNNGGYEKISEILYNQVIEDLL